MPFSFYLDKPHASEPTTKYENTDLAAAQISSSCCPSEVKKVLERPPYQVLSTALWPSGTIDCN